MARGSGDQFSNPLYLNYDQLADRLRIQNSDWPSTHGLVVLDELHAMPQWKAYLKGIFDTKPATQALMGDRQRPARHFSASRRIPG